MTRTDHSTSRRPPAGTADLRIRGEQRMEARLRAGVAEAQAETAAAVEATGGAPARASDEGRGCRLPPPLFPNRKSRR